MNKDFFIALAIIFLSGCSHTKPTWPVESLKSESGFIESRKSVNIVSLFVREPSAALMDMDNFDDFIEGGSAPELTRLLSAMSLDSFFTASLSSKMRSIGKDVLDQTQKIRLREAEYNVKLESMQGKQTLTSLDKSFIVPYIQKRSISRKYLAEQMPRLVLTYGVSTDMSRVGVSAELFSLHTTSAGEAIRCSSLFDASRTLNLSGRDQPQNSVADLARNFHIVRASFQEAGDALVDLLSSHLDLNDIYSQVIVGANDKGNIYFSDYISFDNRYFKQTTALVSKDKGVYMYSSLPAHQGCGPAYLTVQTDQSTLYSMTDRLNVERNLLKRNQSSYESKKFAREQGLRNQEILFKRLGLNEKH